MPAKAAAKVLIHRLARSAGFDLVKYETTRLGADPQDQAVIDFVRPYTMTTPERVYALTQAVRYISRAKIEGAVVECGVWRGGSSMAVARTLLEDDDGGRDLYLFDTFEGMPTPTSVDRDPHGRPALERFERSRTGPDRSSWDEASLEDVRANLALCGYDAARLHFVKGKVEDTIPGAPDGVPAPDRIALLRLDTDWYESTRHELIHLYPRLAPGGVLIIDDYGHWQGSRQAVDEYFASSAPPVLLNRIDYTGRLAVKPG